MNTAMAISQLQQNIESLSARVAEQDVLISKQSALIKYYENQFLLLKRRQFGASSEKTDVDISQMNLFNEIASTIPLPAETEEVAYTRKKRKGKREEDLSGLPVERIDYELPECDRECPECGETMRDIGVDIRRDLKLIPAKVIVMEHAAHAYACRNCQQNSESTPIVKAKSPKPLISGSLASSSLVAHIIAQKYSNSMPLYRLEKGFQYDGVIISRQNMANWVIKCSEAYLEKIYESMKAHLLEESVLHADETTVQVLREPNREAQTKSYEWIYRSSGYSKRKIIIYDYKETRKREHPKTFLQDFKGYLHTDGYKVYHGLPPEIIIVGFNTFALRKPPYGCPAFLPVYAGRTPDDIGRIC
jgi:transposase